MKPTAPSKKPAPKQRLANKEAKAHYKSHTEVLMRKVPMGEPGLNFPKNVEAMTKGTETPSQKDLKKRKAKK